MAKFEYKVFECRIHGREEDKKDFLFEVLIDEEWKDANEIGEEGWELIRFVRHPELRSFRDFYNRLSTPNLPPPPLPAVAREKQERVEFWRGGLFKREKI
jgi:hypothetical protein